MKNNKGITLIALVITIIILIILAGISIAMLMGENGIITKAKQGALNYQNAAVEEQEMLNNFYGDFASGIASATGELSTLTHIDSANAATSDKILKDYKAYVNGELVTGTMNNYSSNPEKITLTAEQNGETTIDIADGYHTDIAVDASAVYNAGVNAGQASAPTLTLVGSYTGNQTIDVSTYLNEGDTADNFMVEIISLDAFSTRVGGKPMGWYSYSASATSLSKSLSGNSLSITGARRLVSGNSESSATGGVYETITYKLWHI